MLRVLVVTHRWLGIVLGPLFAMWFATGIVMHFVPYPQLSESERVSGLPPARVSHFFATGMLINVIASMNLHESAEPWAQRLLSGCKDDS